MEARDIQPGQTYVSGKIRWRIESVGSETAYAVRVRKADGQTWVWDETSGRDFSLAIIREHWELLG